MEIVSHTYSDQEVKQFLDQQKRNFQLTANKGRGFEAKEARQKLERINAMSEAERLNEARATLSLI